MPGYARVEMQLPGMTRFVDLGELAIVNGELVLPLKLLFLCHAREDEATVESLSERLFEDGFLTWFAPKRSKGRRYVERQDRRGARAR